MFRMNNNRMNVIGSNITENHENRREIAGMHPRGKQGFSLGELLVVVLILLILFAIAIPAVITIRKHLRQTELDSKAETVYVAVQNKLSKMQASGNTACLDPDDPATGVVTLPDLPNDVDPDVDDIKAGDIAYFRSADLNTAGTAANEVMKDTSLESSLVNEHWIVEFNPSSAIVYAVFYSENLADCSSEYVSNYNTYDTSYRYKDGRLDGGAKVGYYGGGSADSGSQVTEISPTITVENAEKLTAQIKCTIPTGVSDAPVFKIEMEDTAGNKYTAYYAYWAVDAEYRARIEQEAGSYDLFISGTDKEKIERSGRTYTLNLTLDDLATQDTRFVSKYGNDSTHTTKLLSGTPLKITVTAMCPGNKKITGTHSASAITNSLFADDNCATSGDTDTLNTKYGTDEANSAVIAYGRHLQNLDITSGVVNSVAYAAQGNNIDFSEDKEQTGIYDWYETYALDAATGNTYFNGYCADGVVPNFKAITNTNLKEFSGKLATDPDDTSYIIAHLSEYTTASDSAGGLFSTLSGGQSVRNVTMTGTSVIAKGADSSAGAIAGKVTGDVTGDVNIENCQVYLATEDTKNKSNQNVWISGSDSAGGLVGMVSGGSLAISKSSAATVIGAYSYDAENEKVTSYGTTSVGGLVGTISSGTVSIDKSFADSYLVGNFAGGLVGTSVGSVSVQSCFAAGFLSWKTEAAGLVDGSVSILKNCYTIMSPLYQTDDTNKYYSTAKSGTGSGKVYYSYAYSDDISSTLNLSGTEVIGSLTSAEMTANLGSDFTAASSDVTAYNLMGQSLSSYTYPALVDVGHHGDWSASFKPGALVYYEKYSDNTYGFYGANVGSALKDNVRVVGDGYAIVYATGDAGSLPVSVKVTVEGNTENAETIGISGSTTSYPVKVGEVEYKLYPLSNKNCNISTASSDFYLKATIHNDSTNIDDYYYFNPDYAKTVIETTETAAKPTFAAGSEISIRTARHLYNMSLHYDTYADATENATYDQEKNIDYSAYLWGDFTLLSDCSSQEPIAGGSQEFIASYDGECNTITNVSFISDNGNYVGLFGRIASGADISNVVIVTDYDKASDDNYLIQRKQPAQANESVWLGILAGYNSGTIRNCAVAGYYLAGDDGTIHGYANSHVYIGNFVGQNDGTIINCEADTPRLNLSTYRTVGYAGGFVGYNTSTIRNCYAISHLYCIAQSGSTRIAGFAALNTGTITQSYCATALTASGDGTSTFGFSPADQGVVSSCYYLNTGSYQFVDGLYAYETKTGAATYRTYEQLVKLNTSPVDSDHSYDHPNTAEDAYPYRTVVTDADGEAVHYGEWQLKPELGTLGFFYWEHEEGGDNDGYKLTYVGSDESSKQYQTTLCVSHDDGGVIIEYGYGYYVKNGQEELVTAAYIDAATSGVTVQTAAKDSFNKQMPGYSFYPYTTSDTDANIKSSYGDYICFTGTGTTAQCTLTYNGHSYVYVFTPLFANAMQFVSVDGTPSASINITDNGGTTTDYSAAIGVSPVNPIEIRSDDQLQYMNWNSTTRTATETLLYDDYTGSTPNKWKTFNYLGYCDGGTSVTQAKYYFSQTHDVDAKMTSKDNGGTERFTPIGSLCECNQSNDANVKTAFFNGTYDGKSYTIKNVEIESRSQAVGLFGITISADIQNVILYSTNNNSIRTSKSSGSSKDTSGNRNWYCMGGMVGLAGLGGNAAGGTATFKNCSVSGYNIVDERDDPGYGGTNIGGFAGLCNVNITNCSAVTDISIQPNYSNSSRNIRVGGVIGNFRGEMLQNCYAGGSISSTLSNATNVHIGGIVGGWFARNSGNLGTVLGTLQTKPTVKNCYTYVTLAGCTGTSVKTICPAVSNANDENTSNNFTVSNVYYYDPQGFSGYKQRTVDNNTNVIKVTYEQLSGKDNISGNDIVTALNGDFAWVSTTDASGGKVNGKYSFPGSDTSLNGKDYPFPTVITQTDLSYGNKVNVHYGAWPHDSAYWKNAVDTMDILDSMSVNDGYAYSTFVLEKGSSDLSGLTVDSFTVGDTDPGTTKDEYAEIVKVQQSTDGNSWLVTVKALKNGSTSIKEKTTGASFTLTITGNLTVTADPATMLLDDDQSAKLTVYATSTKENTVVTDAFTLRESPDSSVFSSDPTAASFTVSDTTVAEITGVSKNADGESWTVTVTGLKAGTATIKENTTGAVYRVTVTDVDGSLQTECVRDYSTDTKLTWKLTPSTMSSSDGDVSVVQTSSSVKNVYTVTGYGYDATIYVSAGYDYNGTTYSGTGLVTVQKNGCIGVSYIKDDSAAYMEADVKTGDSGTVQGTDKTFKDAAPVKPANADLYLYDTASAGILDYYVDSCTDETETTEGNIITIKNSTITIAVEGVKDGNTLKHKLDTTLTQTVGNSYSSVGCQLYEIVPEGGTKSGTVNLVITVESENNVKYQFTIANYSLRAMEQVSVKYIEGDKTYAETNTVVNGGNYTLWTEEQLKEKMADEGQTVSYDQILVGWSDGTTTYAPGDTIVINGSMQLTAVWNYVIILDANGGTFSSNNESQLKCQVATRDTQFILQDTSYPVSRTGYLQQDDWNDKQDGSGKKYYKYYAAFTLAELETSSGSNVVYAQWNVKTTHLQLNNSVSDPYYQTADIKVDTSVLVDPTQYTTPGAVTGKVFAGWYTGEDGAGRLIASDEKGVLVFEKNVAGYTDADGKWIYDNGEIRADNELSLYAYWSDGYKLSFINGEDEKYSEQFSEPKSTLDKDPSTLVSAPAEGYTLVGWYKAQNMTEGNKVLNADGTIYAAVSGYTSDSSGSYQFDLTANQKLYACWVKDGKYTFGLKYTVIYDPQNSGASTTAEALVDGDGKAVVTLPVAPTAPSGKSFSGWKSGSDSNVYNAGVEVTIAGTTTFTAQWSDGCQLTLVGAANDGAGSLTYIVSIGAGNLTGAETTTGTAYAKPERSGTEFAGWVTSDYKLVIDADGNMVSSADTADYITNGKWSKSGNVTLYARWKKTVYAKTTTVDTTKAYLIGAAPSGSNKVNLIKANNTALGTDTTFTSASGTNVDGTAIDYITGTVSDNLLWTISSSTNATIRSNSNNYYIYHSNNSNSVSLQNSSQRTWTINNRNGNITYNAGRSTTYYLNPSNPAAASSTSTNCYLYTEDSIYEYSSDLDNNALGSAFCEPALSGNADDEETSHRLTLLNGSSTAFEGAVTVGTEKLSEYIAPTRIAASWTLDGWYTSTDGSGQKVLNADGTVISDDVEGYCSGGQLTLEDDTALYACWSRLTDAYVRTEELVAGEDYLITSAADDKEKASLIAFGQLTAENGAYTQQLTAVDPSTETYGYMLYDEETGTTSEISDLFVTGVTRNLVWTCSDDTKYDRYGALYTQGGYIRIDDLGGYAFTDDIRESTGGWAYDISSNTLQALSPAGKKVSISFCNDKDGTHLTSSVDSVYNPINIYRKVTVLQTSFADETLDLCLTVDNTGTACSIRVVDGSWPEWNGFTQPTREGYRFLGWYTYTADDATQVLNTDGLFASENVAEYIINGKWICTDSNVTLYAKWEKFSSEEKNLSTAQEVITSGTGSSETDTAGNSTDAAESSTAEAPATGGNKEVTD